MTDEELRSLLRIAEADMVGQLIAQGKSYDEHQSEVRASALRAVYNAGLDRAAEIVQGARRIGHNQSEVRGFEQAVSLLAAAIEAEKGQSNG